MWYDEGIAPGHGWRDELASHILGCSLFIIYLSPRSVASEHCNVELSYALDQKVPILAIFVEQTTLPPGLQFALQNKQALERFRYDDEAYRTKLRDSISTLLRDGSGDAAYRPPTQPVARARFDQRYELLDEVASNPGSRMYRAIDYVLGRTVTIKRENAGAQAELGLANEFETIASLPHPNIVKALHFGYEDDGRQFLVLDIQDTDVPLLEAVRQQPVSVVVELLSQGLRALYFLHARGLVHGAIRPSSIVVNNGRLKLMDFAVCRKLGASGPRPDFIGDSAFSAPELVGNAAASEATDLYAMGRVFHDAVVASPSAAPAGSVSEIDAALTAAGVDSRLAGVLAGLLAHDPEHRFRTVPEAFAAFDASVDPVAIETALTRESALQAAFFVGRESELEQLRRSLQRASQGQGGTVLIAGESGVGKSRLLGELERVALVSGFRVMRGHAVEGDAGSFRVWDDVMSHLDIVTHGAAQPHASSADAQERADHELSFLRLETAIRRQQRPTLIVLEDLHWAGTESVKLLSWLTRPAQALPVVIVGTYRPNEAFDPTHILADVQEMRLSRLSQGEVVELAAAVLGRNPDDRLREFLATETEGNSLFIVETLRVLAESAGALDQVESTSLPSRVLSGGMRRILQRRVSRLSDEDMALLRVASLVGRQINVQLMARLAPEVDIDAWASRCAAEAVLEVARPSYRFTHEKLREFVFQTVGETQRLQTHRRVAEGLQALSPDLGAVSTALAHHWAEAGDADRHAQFAFLAGTHLLAGGALHESVDYLKRVEKLLAMGACLNDVAHGPHAAITDKLSEAYFRLGNLAECNAYSKRAITHLGARYPGSSIGMAVDIVLQAIRLLVNRTPAAPQPAAVLCARNYLRLMEVSYYSLKQIPAVWSSLRAVNAARAGGTPEEIAQSHALTAPLASAVNLHSLARAYARRALNASRETKDLRSRSFVKGRLGSWAIANCDWPRARRRLRRARLYAERVGDLRLVEENTCLEALIPNLVGDFEVGLEKTRAVQELAQRVGDRQIACWGAHGESIALIRLGHSDKARPICVATLDVVHDPFMRAEAIAAHSILAVIDQRAGKPANAMVHIEEALQRLADTPGISWWVVSALGCLIEAVFEVEYENRRSEKKVKRNALKRLRGFAKTQPLGQPLWALWSGVALAERGSLRAAARCLNEGCIMATSRGMAYEAARLRLELARLGTGDVGLNALTDSFTNMGCRHELELVRSMEMGMNSS